MLKGEKIYLRPLEKEDLQLRVKWVNDEEVSKTLNFDWPLSLSKTQEWYQNTIQDKAKVHFSIIYKANDIPIGFTGLTDIDFQHSRAAFYLTIGEKEYRGLHIPDETIALILEYAFIELGLKKVYLQTLDINERAQHVYMRNGFIHEGTLRKHQWQKGSFRDLLMYGILKDDWVKSDE